MESADMSKKSTRKWEGLGPNVFDVDYGSMFEEYKEFKNEEEDRATTPAMVPPPAKGQPVPEVNTINTLNQISKEVEVKNTDFHKSIIKARNEYYSTFKTRFESSIQGVMKNYNEYRAEEVAFNNYWNQNLKELTLKHI